MNWGSIFPQPSGGFICGCLMVYLFVEFRVDLTVELIVGIEVTR